MRTCIIPATAPKVLCFHIRTLLKAALVKDSCDDSCSSIAFLVQAQLRSSLIQLSQISDRPVTGIEGNLKQAVSQKRGTSCLRNTSEIGHVVSVNEDCTYIANVLYAAAFHPVIRIYRYIGEEDHPHHGVYCLQ